MAKPKTKAETEPVNHFRFNLTGLILFSLFIMAGTALISQRFFEAKAKPYSFAKNNIPDPDYQDATLFTRKGPWGELLTQSIKLQRPEEYCRQDVQDPQPESWNFANRTTGQIMNLLVTNGLTPEQVTALVTPSHLITNGNNLVLQPDEELLLSLKPETRQRLYTGLYGMGLDLFIDYPYIFPSDTISKIYADPRLHPDDLSLLQQLVYPVTNGFQLSDFNLLLRKIPTPDRRKVMTQVLSRESAVLARLCVRPDSDIDKIASYWGKMDNVRFTDIRPMLEALKELPNGGTVSLLYFMPPFARSRLYTFPIPPQPGDPRMDCHWTTFNFHNVEPDNRFSSPQYASDYLQKNFYHIEAPSLYGDVVLLMNARSEIKHSAVFLADDLTFTKYGDNYRQPWMIVRISDMLAIYPSLKPVYYRQKTE